MNLPDFYGQWTQARENGRQRVLGRQINETMPGALQGDQNALQRLLKLDPRTGMGIQSHVAQQQKAQADQKAEAQKRLGQTAAQLLRAVQSGDPNALQGTYTALYQTAKQMDPNADLPEAFDPNDLPEIHKLVALGGADASDDASGVVVGGNLVDKRTGRVMYEAPERPDFHFYESADGPVWLPKPGRGTGGAPMAGGAPAPSQGVSGGASQMLEGAYQGAGNFGNLRDAVEWQESRGNPNAVSPAGAMGRMQTMPGTLRDPGFGIAPARDKSDAEMTRVGNEYLQAMLQKYGDPQLALAAYNAGPGRVDAALRAAGGNPQAAIARLPAETRNYVPSVLNRAGQGGGMGAIPIQGVRPKAKDGPEETFSQPQEVMNPQTGRVELVQFGNRGGRRVVSGYAPKPSGEAVKPPTEGERSAAGFLGRMVAAEKELDSLTERGYTPNVRDHYSAGQGPLRNWAATEQGQVWRQKQEDWVRAKLRKESGAAIPTEEMDREITMYFPQPGDSEAVREAKRRSRQEAARQIQTSAGRAASPQRGGTITKEQALEKYNAARAAIQRGADRNQVRQRMIQMGLRNLAELL